MCHNQVKKSNKAMSVLLVSGFTLSSISTPLVTYANTPVEQKQDDVQHTVDNLPAFPEKFDQEFLFEVLSHDLIIFEEGMDNLLVEQLKLSLQELGFGADWKTLTTAYDAEMKEVVEEFQEYYVLSVNGKIDEETQETLEKLLIESPQLDDENQDIGILKEKLHIVLDIEFSEEQTNNFDENMKQLVEEFQLSQDLVVNGIMDSVTLEKLEEVYEEIQSEEASEEQEIEEEVEQEVEQETSHEEPRDAEETTEESTDEEQAEEDEKISGEETVEEEVVSEAEVVEEDVQEQKAPAMARMATSVTYYAEGMRSADVKKMKQNLVNIGFGTHWKNPTTLFGKDTVKVVKEFQRYYGLSADGSMGPASLAKLDEVLKSPYQKGKRSNAIKTVKNKLKSIGYGTHWKNPTTLYGADTVKVVKDFQKKQGLVVNGIIDSKTLSKINQLYDQSKNTVYKQRMRSADIKKMKQQLKQLGFGTHWKNPTTLYGSDTVKVVKEFQAYYGLPVQNTMDKTAQNRVSTELNSNYKKGKKSNAIKTVKNKLKALGYANHWKNPTTLYGKDTVKVVKDFQKKNKLVENGIIDSVTLSKINSLHANMKPETPSETVGYTNYGKTLTQAVNDQLTQSTPRTDKYRNDPAYVSSSYVKWVGTVANTTTGKANIRTKPESSSKRAGLIKEKETVEIKREVTGGTYRNSNVWYEIVQGNGVAYIHSSLLNRHHEATANVNVRAGKGTSTHVYGLITKGTKVTVKNVQGAWAEIAYQSMRNATTADVRAAIDPAKTDKFQHLRLDKLAGATASQLNKSLAGKGTLNNQGQAFVNGAKNAKVNEAYLVAHAILETGNGKSKLAQGIEVGLESGKATVVTPSNKKSLTKIKKVYNMFGIGAVDADPNNKGAIRAYEEGWDTPKKAIEGGAKWVGSQYIYNEHQQNTLYKMRWNPKNVIWKQYATDIGWASKQVVRIKEVYSHIDKPSYHYDYARYK